MAYTSPYRKAAESEKDPNIAAQYLQQANQDEQDHREQVVEEERRIREKAKLEQEEIQDQADQQIEQIENNGSTGSGVLDTILGR